MTIPALPNGTSEAGSSKNGHFKTPDEPASVEAKRYLDKVNAMTTAWMQHGEADGTPVAKWSSSSALRKNVKLALPDTGLPEEEVFSTMQAVLDNSVNPWTGRFLDKLYAAPRPVGLAAEALLAALNANGHVMSASPMLCLAEEACVDGMAELCGWDAAVADGLTMPGGSSSNTLAVQTALANRFPSLRTDGALGASFDIASSNPGRTGRATRPLIFTSSQSHYSLDKAAMGCGLGLSAVVKVPCDEQGRMNPEELERMIVESMKDTDGTSTHAGFPFFVNATAGTTVLGSFDQLDKIAVVTSRYNLWLHVDGSWGGPVLFSSKWRHLMQGIEQADSLAINPHKLMNAPLQCSFALFRKGSTLEANALDAAYLFHSENSSAESGDKATRRENPGTMAYGCGRRGDALKLYLLWQRYGRAGLGAHVDQGFELAKRVSQLIQSERFRDTLELGPQPDPLFLQVCFRPKGSDVQGEDAKTRAERLSKGTHHVYSTFRERRKFAVDFAPLPGGIGDFIRLVTHPLTSFVDLEALVAEVAEIGVAYASKV